MCRLFEVIKGIFCLSTIGHNVPVKDAFKHTEDGPTGTAGTTACTNGHLGAGDPEATETDSSGKQIKFYIYTYS